MISSLELSIIVPAFNEERRLPKTLDCIHAYLTARSLRGEIIVVDDGSTDGTTKVVESARQKYPEVRLLSNGRNRGKGFSVRHGMLEARGGIALFSDADLSTPMEEADKLVQALHDDRWDGAIGSRAINRGLIDIHQSRFRETAGIIFNRIVRVIAGLQFADTQCGFKAFRRERTRIIFEQQRIEGFGFDPEILFLARRHRLGVAEIPVHWAHDPASKVRVLADSMRMFRDLFLIRWNALIGRYPDGKTSGFSREQGGN